LKFNTKIRYGLRAMVEIALDESGNGVFQKDISEKQKISVKYLDPIISSLKIARLIMNTRGKKSGYKLTRKPEEIKILDIYLAFEPGIAVVDCINKNYSCDLAINCGVKDFWGGLNATIIKYFESYTLADLVREHKLKMLN
jgi:Rrf2 family protein